MPKPFKDGARDTELDLSFSLGGGSRRGSVVSEMSETIDPRGLVYESSPAFSSSNNSSSTHDDASSVFEEYSNSSSSNYSVDPIVVSDRDTVDEPMLSASHLPTPLALYNPLQNGRTSSSIDEHIYDSPLSSLGSSIGVR